MTSLVSVLSWQRLTCGQHIDNMPQLPHVKMTPLRQLVVALELVGHADAKDFRVHFSSSANASSTVYDLRFGSAAISLASSHAA